MPRRRRASRRVPKWAPEPPAPMPPGRVVHVPARGEVFVRDTGDTGDGRPPVLLLHGWMFSADLNWWRAYGPLRDAGHRVLAVDHRGHGRGIRTPAPFRLEDCAADAAGVLDQLGIDSALVVGYSMGGPIAQLMARDHPAKVSGLVLCATSSHWRDPAQRLVWSGLAVTRFVLGLAPDRAWRRGLRLAGFPDSPVTTWTTAELTRGSAVDLAEAGRRLNAFDSRPWIGELPQPAAVVVTTKDRAVRPRNQRDLAHLVGGPAHEVRGDHGACVVNADAFNAALLAALRDVTHARRATPAAA